MRPAPTDECSVELAVKRTAPDVDATPDDTKRSKIDEDRGEAVSLSQCGSASATAGDADSVRAPLAVNDTPHKFGGGFGDLAKGQSGFAFGGGGAFGGPVFPTASAFNIGAAATATCGSVVRSLVNSDGAGVVNGGEPQAPVQALSDGSHTPLAGAPHVADTAAQVFGSALSNAADEGDAAGKASHETGEEGEQTVFSAKASLYVLDRSASQPAWKERGVGVVRINLTPGGRSRIIMRQTGILRLLLNAYLFPEMTLQRMDGRARVSFMCANAEVAAQAAAPARGALSQQTESDCPCQRADNASAVQQAPPAAERPAAADAVAAEDDQTCAEGSAAPPLDEVAAPGDAPAMQLFALKMGSMENLERFVATVERYKHGRSDPLPA